MRIKCTKKYIIIVFILKKIAPVFPQLFYTSTTESNVDGFETVNSQPSPCVGTTTAQPVQSTSAELETESTALKAEATTIVTLTTTTSAEPITTTITTEFTTTIKTTATTTASTTDTAPVALSYRDKIKVNIKKGLLGVGEGGLI